MRAARVVMLGLVGVIGVLSWVRSRQVLPDREARREVGGIEYWLHIPGACGAGGCPALVFVHGTGHTGGQMVGWMRGVADRDGVVLICPGFARGYMTLANGEDAHLQAILADVREQVAYTRLVVAGFSGGGQFSHRFAFANPAAVDAIATHSAGSFSIPGAPPGMPILVTVGTDDERLEPTREAVEALRELGAEVTYAELPGVPHAWTSEAREATMDLVRRVSSSGG